LSEIREADDWRARIDNGLMILFVPGVERIDGRACGYVFPVLLLLKYVGKWVIHRENGGRESSRIFRRYNAHKSQGPVCRGIVNHWVVVMFVTGVCRMSLVNASGHTKGLKRF